MWRLSYLAVLVCLAGGVAGHISAASLGMRHPDDGAIANGVYTNAYFNLSYPLPPGWTEGIAGPGPSQSGYYVLGTFVPAGELAGTILIAAQDMLFAAKPFGDATAAADEFSRAMSKVEGMTLDRPPLEVRIAGRSFTRVDFSGVGLFRSTLITQTRCHLVSLNLTAKSPELLATLALTLNNIGFAGGDRGAERIDPTCIGNYADREHLLTKVDPAAIGPTSTPIPVRVVIGTDGGVRDVHVIRATGGQRDSIENALGRWKFEPPERDGRTTDIETGLLIEFTPAGTVKYSTGNRSPLNGPG